MGLQLPSEILKPAENEDVLTRLQFPHGTTEFFQYSRSIHGSCLGFTHTLLFHFAGAVAARCTFGRIQARGFCSLSYWRSCFARLCVA